MEYVFRVLLDSDKEEDVFRDISIDSNSSFELLHTAIVNAFEFEGGQMASFYLTDEEWNKGDEIGLMDMSGEGANFQLMDKTPINSLLAEQGDKVLYVYDFLNMWCFYVELVKISPLDADTRYPNLELSFGDAPSEQEKDILDDYSLPPVDEYGFDEYGSGDYNDDEFAQFENIDDLDI